jgi:hypothetical protein
MIVFPHAKDAKIATVGMIASQRFAASLADFA